MKRMKKVAKVAQVVAEQKLNADEAMLTQWETGVALASRYVRQLSDRVKEALKLKKLSITRNVS
jgi:hypothetical protein